MGIDFNMHAMKKLKCEKLVQKVEILPNRRPSGAPVDLRIGTHHLNHGSSCMHATLYDNRWDIKHAYCFNDELMI